MRSFPIIFRPGKLLLAALLCTVAFLARPAVAQAPLATGFLNPPPSARPHTWWHWLNGNVTRAGITADLEAMARVGVGGAEIFNVDQGIPAGPIRFMSPQWLDMMKFAGSEANRLGLELCMMNCAGWSSSGGPWNTPDHAMQFLTFSEQHVKGPLAFDGALAQPPTRLKTYHDISVLAFRTPPAEMASMTAAGPTITASTPDVDAGRLTDGNPATYIWLPKPTAGGPAWLQFQFPAPFRARMLRIQGGPGRNETSGELQISDDGEHFRTVRSIGLTREVGRAPGDLFNFEPVTARYWRVLLNSRVSLAEVELSSELRIPDIEAKAGFVREDHPRPMTDTGTPDAVVSKVIDLTAQLQGDGKLTWQVPEGDWTILRCGYTPTGARNEPAPPEGTGPEVDKMSREAVDAHWAHSVEPVIKAMGPLTGNSFRDVLIDSYEVGSQNWTPLMRQEFMARRGYDPIPWLPVCTGRVVSSPAESERFLWDLRRTCCDLFAENYSGRFAQLAHQNGMIFSAEPYGNGMFEDTQYGGATDIPMGEFWAGDSGSGSCKLAASIGHTYGQRIIGAESFTSTPQHARWTNDPYSLKALGDIIFCTGVNRFIFHRYAMQPWLNRAPGMTMGPWGINFERTNTWWNQGAAWLKYLARCQFLLQQGLFVGDVVAFDGDDGPNSIQAPAGLPPGYDYDGIDSVVLRNHLTVNNERLALPDGMSYRLLTLPNTDAMTPETLTKLAALVRDGATIVGPRPTHSPSLQGFPGCDDEVKRLAADVWGNCDGKTITEHDYGKGRVFWGRPLAEVLTTVGVMPDFLVSGAGASYVHYIHRMADGTDIYFVASAAPHSQTVLCSFRMAGRQPELWHPDTGLMEACPVWKQVGARTEIPLDFPPSGSMFVVFRAPSAGSHLTTVERQGPEAPRPPAPKLTIVKATYGVLSLGTDKVDVTRQVQGMVRQGTRKITASNALAGDPAANEVKEMLIRFEVNGVQQSHTMAEGESFELPAGATVLRAIYGLDPDQVPDPTQVMDLTARLSALVKDGELHAVANNELAGRDPASMVPKQMEVVYQVDGQTKTVMLNENQALDLPGDILAGANPPAYEIQSQATGVPMLLARLPGRFTFTYSDDKKQSMDVGDLPAPITVAGPWQVTFPPNLGAPPQATFDKLISWPNSTDPGVKYFSGTATYRTHFTAPAVLLGKGCHVALDLGNVQVIAEPSVNGHALGVLWKPPFYIDITGLLHAGDNTLEVKVTNLWPNRLIGDEQYPDDTKYTAGGNIAEWPEWLLKGAPRPEPRRVTFTTWKLWHKGDDLLPSGLIGPVRIEAEVQVPIPAG